MNLRGVIKQLIKETVNFEPVWCKVTSRDDVALTCVCSPISGLDSDFSDVRLKSSTGNGVVYYPSVNSIVIVQPMQGNNTGIILMYSQLDKIQFLDGSFGGLVEVANLTQKLNNLESKVNDLISTFNSHVHTGVTTGAGSSGTTPTAVSGSLTPTNRSDIENTLITHGTV